MNRPGRLKRLVFVSTAAIVPSLIVAACAIQLRGDDDRPPAASSASRTTDSVAPELERCRAVTPEQVADIQKCRRIWAENRRRFLGQKKVAGAPSADTQPNIPPQPKDPGGVLRDRPPVATPKSE